MVLIVPDTYLVSINAESGGQPVTNVIGIEKAFSNAEDVTAKVLAAWTALNGPLQHQNVGYVMKDVRAMFLGTAEGEVYTRTASNVGPKSGAKATNAACALVNYGGGSRARTSKGRMYFGPLIETDINADGRTLVPTFITALTGSFGQFKDQLAANGMAWVVISRKLQTTATIGNIGVQNVVATQRRRLR